MAVQLITTKITPTALQAARLIAAKTGEKQYEAVQRVLEDEARRLGLLPKQSKADPNPRPAAEHDSRQYRGR